ncbi:hypothetical protein LCGC14_0780040 [marine sediment metagenome]|uniref:Uncharacterized protein n=1 Tax=marine sediment metagenome TaxID=412755 RepID=A0A0F9PW04_9ZZZZ|nr:MAG: hypothetical protein Lokiarch_46720 [Candidatus Lokiarchaeum sp. GC14_75]
MKEETKSTDGISEIFPFSNHSYGVDIRILNEESTLSFHERRSFVHNVTNLSRVLLFGLFGLVASESLKENYSENIKDDFRNVSGVLFQKFGLNHLDNKGSLEKSLELYIRELSEYKYYVPGELVKESKEGLVPREFNLGFKGNIEAVSQCIKNALISLRNEKIKFWRALSKMYKQDKEAYDLNFRTREKRHKKDLDRAYRIDINEFDALNDA